MKPTIILKHLFAALLCGALLVFATTALHAQTTWYSYQSGNFNAANIWTTDPSGTTLVGSGNLATDNYVILNGRTITLTANSQLNQAATRTVTINSGGVLDLSTFTTQTIGVLSGQGTLSINGVAFPTVTTNNLVTSSGGTVNYYNAGGTLPAAPASFNNLQFSNSTGSAVVWQLVNSNLTVLGTFTVNNTGAGTNNFQINSTTQRTLRFSGNILISSGSLMTVGTAAAAARHAMGIAGNFTNNGTVRLFDNTGTFTAANYFNLNVFTSAETNNAVEATFTGSSNTTLYCNGTTDFYKFRVRKGSDQTYTLRVLSSAANQFRVFGPANQGGNVFAPTDTTKSFFVFAGTLRLGNNISIPVLSSGGQDFNIVSTAALWVDSASVYTHPINGGYAAATCYGTLRITAGTFSTGVAAGIVLGSLGTPTFNISGGTLDASNIWDAGGGGTTSSYIISGGNVNMRSNGAVGSTGQFNLRNANCVFNMTGGNVNILRSLITTGVSGNAVEINASTSNFSATAGNINVWLPGSTGNQPARIEAPNGSLPNLSIRNVQAVTAVNYVGASITGASITAGGTWTATGTGWLTPATGYYTYDGTTVTVAFMNSGAWDIAQSVPGTLTATLSGGGSFQLTPTWSGATPGNLTAQVDQALTVSGALTIGQSNATAATQAVTLNANSNNITVGGNFNLGAFSTYTPGTNTTFFNGTSPQVITLNAATTFSSLNCSGSSSVSLLAGSTAPTVSGTFTIGSGVTFTDNGVVVTCNGNVSNSGTATGSSTGGITLAATAAAQTISGNGTYRNLTLNNTNGAAGSTQVTATGNITITNLLTLTSARVFAIGTNGLTFSSGASISGTVGATRYIQTAGNRSDGGISFTFTSTANTFTWPFGVGAKYTPITINATTTGTYGTVTARPVNTVHPNNTSTTNILNYYYRVVSSGWTGTLSVSHSNYTYATTDITGASATFTIGRYNPTAYTWGRRTATFNATIATGNTTAPTFNTGTGWTGGPGTDVIDGEYTVGQAASFGAVTVYYSRATGTWSDASATGPWSTASVGGAACSCTPTTTAPVVIGDGASNNHTITVTASGITVGSLSIAAGSVLDLTTTIGHNFGANVGTGVTGTGRLRISAAPATQASPNGTITTGTNTMTVSSATGIQLGMVVLAQGGTELDNNPYVTNINGTTITLSANASGTLSGAAVTFGYNRSVNATTTNGSTNVTVASRTLFAGIKVGDLVTGTGIPAGTYVTAVTPGGTPALTLSQNATVSATNTLTFAQAQFPAGDWGAFLAAGGGTVEYYRSATGAVDFAMPTYSVSTSSITSYQNLWVDASAASGTPTLGLAPATTTVNNQLLFRGLAVTQGTVYFANTANGNFTVGGNFNVTAGTVQLQNNGTARNIVITGIDSVGIGATFGVVSGATGATGHTLTLSNNLVNRGTFDLLPSANSQCALTFTGSSTNRIAGTGITLRYYTLTVNKGSSAGSILYHAATATTLTPPTAGNFTLSNGTFYLISPSTWTLANNAFFTIPSTAALTDSANAATGLFQITGTGGGLLLNGALNILSANSTVTISNAANGTNYIEYAAAGSPTINITGGALNVDGPIRRNVTPTTGALRYAQSGGTVTVGISSANYNAAGRGVFEIENNAGSSFTMSGGTLVLQRTNTTASPTIADLYLNPSTSNVTGGTIQFGNGSTPATQNFILNATCTLPNVSVNTTSTPTATLSTNNATILGNLTIGVGATFNANSLNITFTGTNSTLSGTGTFTATNSTVNFNGGAGQQISGVRTMQNLNVNAGTLTVGASSNQTITGNLGIASGTTLADGGSTISVAGNVTNSGTHSGAGAISLTNAAHTLSGNGNGIFQNLTLVGGAASTTTAGANFTINGTLTLGTSALAALLNIGSNNLAFGVSAGAVTVTGGSPSATNMIVVSGSSSDAGVTKTYNSGNTNFTFPVGTGSNYTPAVLNFTGVTGTWSYTVKAVNSAHPTSVAGQVLLNYYWLLNPAATPVFTGVTGNFQFPTSLVGGSGGTPNAFYYSGTAWNGGTSVTGTNPLTINFNSTGFYSNSAQFAYSYGTTTSLPATISTYYSRNAAPNITTTGADWDLTTSWTLTSDGSGGAVASLVNGNPRVVLATHIINTTAASRQASMLTINGTVALGTTVGHNFGTLSGTGVLSLAPTVNSISLPAGDYTSFTGVGGGTIQYGGTGSYTLPTQSVYRNLTFSGSGTGQTLTFPAISPAISGNLTMNATSTTATLDLNGRSATVTGNLVYNVGNTGIFTLNGGSLAVSGTATIDGASGSTLSLGSGGALTVSGTTAIQGTSTVNLNTGTLTATGAVTQSNGTLNGNSGTANYNGGFTQSGGTYAAGSSNINLGGTTASLSRTAGTFTAGTSTVTFSGTGAQTLNGLSGANTLNNLTVNKSSGTLTFNSQNDVNGVLTLTAGNIVTTSTNTLNMSTAATTSGGSASSYVQGPMQYNVATTTATTDFFPIGLSGGIYRPASLTVTQTAATNSVYAAFLTAGGPPARTGALGTISNVRYWTITKTGGPTISAASVTLNYGSDDQVTDPANVVIYKDNGAGAWINLGGPAVGSPTGSITSSTNFTTFSDFVLGNNGSGVNPFPVRWLSFTATRTDAGARLAWATASEINNDRFEVERSTDATSFTKIGAVLGSGTTNSVTQYTYLDADAPQGTVFYRLRQVDYDGSAEYSLIIELGADERTSNSYWRLAPVPTDGTQLNLIAISDRVSLADQHTLWLVGADGTLRAELRGTLQTIGEQLRQIVQQLPVGFYSARISNGRVLQNLKFIKQ